MGKSKKVVLFIVEGISDETSLALVLSRIIEKDNIVRFKIISGDITTENGVTPTSILRKLTDKIKEFLRESGFSKSDILNIVHLVDTDGTFVDDNLVQYKEIDNIEYCAECIYAKKVEDIRKRNAQKAQNINKLVGINNIYVDIPYRIYFFSCNLEHVLHNIQQNLTNSEKMDYAYKFTERFIDTPLSVVEFFNDSEIAVCGEYEETWNFIEMGLNSLSRYANFHLYLNQIVQ